MITSRIATLPERWRKSQFARFLANGLAQFHNQETGCTNHKVEPFRTPDVYAVGTRVLPHPAIRIDLSFHCHCKSIWLDSGGPHIVINVAGCPRSSPGTRKPTSLSRPHFGEQTVLRKGSMGWRVLFVGGGQDAVTKLKVATRMGPLAQIFFLPGFGR